MTKGSFNIGEHHYKKTILTTKKYLIWKIGV